MSEILRYSRYLLSSAVMFGSAPPFFAVWCGWRGVSLVLPKWMYQTVDDFMFGAYQRLVLFFYEHCTGLKVYFSGDIDCLKSKETVLYFSNHQSSVDWIICNMVAIRQHSIGHLRYVMKNTLQALPLYGFYFYEHGCVYVKRGGFKPKKMLQALEYLRDPEIKSWVVIFPEGTRYMPNHPALEKSRKAAEDANLPVLENLLTPKYKGSWLLFEKMRDRLDAVYNVTCIYDSARSGEGRRKAPQLVDILLGRCPEIHINLRRIPIADVPVEEEQFRIWLHNLYLENDKFLQPFYDSSNPCSIKAGGKEIKLSVTETLPSFLFFAALLVPLSFSTCWRGFYLKTCTLGTLAGYSWLALKSVA